MNRCLLVVAAVLPQLGLCGCGDSTAPLVAHKADLAAEAPAADFAKADDVARAAMAITGSAGAVAEVFTELAHAVGDLVPTEDNPCPGGGSASGSLSGSPSKPRVRMHFEQCVRGEHVLDGIAVISCDNFDGKRCKNGHADIGEGETPLRFSDPQRLIVLAGGAYIIDDEPAQTLRSELALSGELRSLDDQPGYAFSTSKLGVDVHRLEDGNAEVRIDGVAAFDSAEGADCVQGQFDTETLEQQLLVSNGKIVGGQLRLSTPPPRPGTQQAQVMFRPDGADISPGDGTSQPYTGEQLAQFCKAPSSAQ